jgi:pimeloyl-ACP methyl ester carboxylesterase
MFRKNATLNETVILSFPIVIAYLLMGSAFASESVSAEWAKALDDPAKPAPIAPRTALVLSGGGGGRPGRTVLRTDPVLVPIVAGTWTPPQSGDKISLADGSMRTWETVEIGDDGALKGAAGRARYAYVAVPSDSDRVMVLEASGHEMVYVNGEPRMGDVYGYDYVSLPVHLKTGINHFLFASSGRGGMRLRLVPPKQSAQISLSDNTLPDLVVGQPVKTWGAIVVLNNTGQTLAGFHIESTIAGSPPNQTPVPALPPCGTRKIGFLLEGEAPDRDGEREVSLTLVGGDDKRGEPVTIKLGVRRSDEKRKVTFLSDIDGSVQYFGLVPAKPSSESPTPATPPGLILTLHGASVEGMGQANVYSPKSWAHVVAPTNRRPYGFDWEDWGRLDAMEVLEYATRELNTDPRHTYLTGHSMGGHGTWILGATYPDRFAAIAPSAGWVSMVSYAGARRIENPTPLDALLQRASSPSDTLALAPNFAAEGVYVLHGDADDNVPVDQARNMRKVLSEFHTDFSYYERPGAGHWWGNPCCDWPPLVEFLARHELPKREDIRRVKFRTASPGVSGWCHWVGIEDQLKSMAISTVDVRWDPEKRRFSGTTENVARLAIDLAQLAPGKPISIELDGHTIDSLEWPDGQPRVWLQHQENSWLPIPTPAASMKGPSRYGPFREAFRHRVQLVYGTRGTPEENACSLAKARYDAEAFWYRGNGSMDVLPDTSFDPKAEPDRNVIVYGNADTNAAWQSLLGSSPVQVRRGLVKVGERELKDEDLGCLFLQPRPGSDNACVGVIAGSGPAGMRLNDRLPYFVSGVGYPDLLVLGPETLTKGTAGLKCAGFFGSNWSVDTGEFVWQY